MNAAEIKHDLFRKLDNLKGNTLEEAYGLLINLINSKKEINDWDDLTNAQQNAILLGINQLDEGKGRSHDDVMSDLRTKFPDA
ncbi:hypothetical protein NBT05_17380 [Aquimarina sp. ERC-38]|uniref:hypothetical protein n=1 Tax=Aquimarina sp. ERC-38 TaxID=2949996 RepID=UPI0022455938|nr:hypothetical protein [Aquimarina sp. ERC-38]UZO80701.1 hypothetical protein NBT05_17380 [Aquimarina sp. ERC-38]